MLINFIFNSFFFPKKLYNSVLKFFLLKKIKNSKNIEIGDGLKINGIPIIDIRCSSKLIIEKNVSLNSNNDGYHVNMHSPVKLLSDRKDSLIKIGSNTRINGSCIHAYSQIIIGENCLIAANCHIFDGNGHDLSFPDVANRVNTFGGSKPIIIEDNVWIGINSIICPGVVIGFGSIVSANSVVNQDVPPMSIVAGNPAVVIKTYKNFRYNQY